MSSQQATPEGPDAAEKAIAELDALTEKASEKCLHPVLDAQVRTRFKTALQGLCLVGDTQGIRRVFLHTIEQLRYLRGVFSEALRTTTFHNCPHTPLYIPPGKRAPEPTQEERFSHRIRLRLDFVEWLLSEGLLPEVDAAGGDRNGFRRAVARLLIDLNDRNAWSDFLTDARMLEKYRPRQEAPPAANAAPGPRRKKRVALSEAERRVCDYLRDHGAATVRATASATGVPVASVGRTDAWKARPKASRRSPRGFSLSDKTVDSVPDKRAKEPPDELEAREREREEEIARLAKEQKAEDEGPPPEVGGRRRTRHRVPKNV